MSFKRFVESGRVAFVADGEYKGKLVSIVDVIDQTRVLVDGPETHVPRGSLRLSQLHLTKFKISFPYTASTRVVRAAWKKAEINKKWSESMWAKKCEAKKIRASMSDFDRFKLRKAKQRRNKIRGEAFFRLRKAASRDGTLYGKKCIAKSKVKPRPKVDKKTGKVTKPTTTKPATKKVEKK